MAEYKIKLGVELDTNGIRGQVNKIKVEPIKLDIDSKEFYGKVGKIRDKLQKDFNFKPTAAKKVTQDLAKMNLSIQNITTSLKKNGNIQITVKGLDKLNRAVTLIKEYNKDAELVGKRSSASYNAKAIKDINESLVNGKFDKQIINAEVAMNRLTKTSPKFAEVAIAMNKVKTAFSDMQNAFKNKNNEALIAANNRYKKSLEALNNQLGINIKTEQQANSLDNLQLDKQVALLKLESLFESGSQAAKKYAGEVQRLKNEIDKCANDKGMGKINKQISILDRQIDNEGLKREAFGTGIKKQFDRYKNYFSVASLFMYASQGLRSMFEQVKLIDSAMTELKKVTNETDASYDQFLKNAASRAKVIGTTIDGLVNSTADFARLGYDFKEAQGLAEVANIYTVVGDEIDGVEDATQSLVSTLAAFKDEMGDMSDSDFAMSIVDKFNEVSNNFSITSGGIGEALQRSASSLATANTTLDESIALITAANTVVQNPEKVGKWLCRLKKWLYRLNS